MYDTCFSEEILARHRCRIDRAKLLTAPIAEWERIKECAHSIEVLRAQIAQVEEQVTASRDADATWKMNQNIRKLREVILTLFPIVKPYLA